MKRRDLLSLMGLSALAPSIRAENDKDAQPLVIAHRGASGYLPENTLGSFELAIRMGADYIEPDLQLSRDGELVVMHDETLERTTDVTERFEKRNGAYRVADFALAEVRALTVRPTGTAQAEHPGFTPTSAQPWRVPTFQEVIDLARSPAHGREIGLYPEAKLGDERLEDGILRTLAANGYNEQSKVFIQSFSDQTLRKLRARQKREQRVYPQLQLGAALTGQGGKGRVGIVEKGKVVSVLEFWEVARFAEGIGVVINEPRAPLSTHYIRQAHAAGLKVHGWTFKKADPGEAAAEYEHHLQMGLDGLISNFPDLAVRARDAFVRAR